MTLRPNRRLLLPALLLAHGAVLLLAAQGGSGPAAAPLSAIAVSAVRSPAPPAVAALEPKLIAVTASVAAPVIEIAGEAPSPAMALPVAASGAGCELAASVEASLRASPVARAALAAIPRAARSAADAQMFWDGHWVSDSASDAIKPIRDVVAAAIRAAPPDCRDAPLTGPRLLFVPEASGTRVLGFGSGVWAWSQLLTG